MSRFAFLNLALVGLAISACSDSTQNLAPAGEGSVEHDSNAKVIATAEVRTPAGEQLGTVELQETTGRIFIAAVFEGLDQGEYAFHLHATGLCDAPDFKSAGGHLNPLGKTHGKLSEGGAHLGDLPNLIFNEEQMSEATVAIEGEASKLFGEIFDEDGTAVMLHSGPDDYVSDPAGAAGPRIACGILVRADD